MSSWVSLLKCALAAEFPHFEVLQCYHVFRVNRDGGAGVGRRAGGVRVEFTQETETFVGNGSSLFNFDPWFVGHIRPFSEDQIASLKCWSLATPGRKFRFRFSSSGFREDKLTHVSSGWPFSIKWTSRVSKISTGELNICPVSW